MLLKSWHCKTVLSCYEIHLSGSGVAVFFFSGCLLQLSKCPSQQPWSCQDVVSILWGFQPKPGCHDTQNGLENINIHIGH